MEKIKQTKIEQVQTKKAKFDMTKFVKSMVTSVVALCFSLTTVALGIGFFYTGGGGKPSLAVALSELTLADLPSNPIVYTKTSQSVEEVPLKNGRIYHFEVFGGKGGNGDANKGIGGNGGNGSYAHGWYDMRTLDGVTAIIFAGGGGTNSAGWGATQHGEQLKGTPGGSVGGKGGGGGGASGVLISHPIIQGGVLVLVAGGGGGGGGGSRDNYSVYRGGDGGNTHGGGYYASGGTQTHHGEPYSGNTKGSPGNDNGGGNAGGTGGGAGGGAGGGYSRGFAGAGGNGVSTSGGPGGGGSGGSSFTGGVQSLKNSAKSSTWAHPNANGNGKVVITEYVMSVNVASPTSTGDYLVSAPSETDVPLGGSYTFTITREIGMGDVGLQLNSSNGVLELTSTNGNVFNYTVSDVQGVITSNDFSTTSYNVAKPPDDVGYTVSGLSDASVLKGGLYSFTITLSNGYTRAFVKLNNSNGKLSYSGIGMDTLTVTVSNVQGVISASDFVVSVAGV